jgi:hypothetical protein
MSGRSRYASSLPVLHFGKPALRLKGELRLLKLPSLMSFPKMTTTRTPLIILVRSVTVDTTR